MRCPGSELQRSRRLSTSKPSRLPGDRRGSRRSRVRPAEAIWPPPARRSCSEPGARHGHLHPYKDSEEAEPCRLGGGILLGISQFVHPVLTPSEGTEVEVLDLVGGEDLVLEQAEEDRMVSLIERDDAAKVASFCSNHILGTALPPPSVGGLRPNSPVSCGFAVLRPTLSRRPRAVGAGNLRFPLDGRELAPMRAAVTCRLQRTFSSCRCPPPLLAGAGMLRRAFGRNDIPQAVRVGAASPSRCFCRRSISVCREPSGRVWPPSLRARLP